MPFDDRQSMWIRQGRILAPEHLPSGIRLIQSPTAWVLSNGMVRIAVAVRDAQNISSMMVLDVDPENGMRIVRAPSQTSITPEFVTKMGYAGLGPCDAIWHLGQLWLYASQLTLVGETYDTSIMLLTSDDEGETFSDPFTILTSETNNGLPVTMPTVRHYSGSWHMWFTAFEAWQMDIKQRPDARYAIRYARSKDGMSWTVQPGRAVALAGEQEAGLASPTVSPNGRPEELWFSVREGCESEPSRHRYRLAYARARGDESWQRVDSVQGFVNSPDHCDWDCKMQCYPNVIELPDGRTCMFYCGNGYGAAGFGFAIRCDENNATREAGA